MQIVIEILNKVKIEDTKLHDAKYDLELTFQLFKKLCVL